MPKKTNPRRVPVISESQRTDIRRKAMKRCWAQIFSVLADKHGYDNETLGEFWEAVNAVSYKMIGKNPELSINTVINELLRDNIDVRKVFVGNKNSADNVRKEFEVTANAIMLYTLKHDRGFEAEEVRRVWQEVNNCGDSLRRGYIKIKDLIDTLCEETGARICS